MKPEVFGQPGGTPALDSLVGRSLNIISDPEIENIVAEALKNKDSSLLQLAWGHWRFRHIEDSNQRTMAVMDWMESDTDKDIHDQNWFRREVINHVPLVGSEQRLEMIFQLLSQNPEQAFVTLDEWYAARLH